MANKFEYRAIGTMGKTLGGTRIRFRYLTQSKLAELYKLGVSNIEKVELDVKPKAKKKVKNESENNEEQNNIKSQKNTGETGEVL